MTSSCILFSSSIFHNILLANQTYPPSTVKRPGIKSNTLIELPPVYRYAYGQYDDGEIVFWALGSGGWYRISPAKSYKAQFEEMVETMQVFYYLADTYRPSTRTRQSAGKSRPAQRKIEDVIRGLSTALPQVAADESKAKELLEKHHRFLIGRFLKGKEDLNWEQSSIWKYMEQNFPEQFSKKDDSESSGTATPIAGSAVSQTASKGKRTWSAVAVDDGDGDADDTGSAAGPKRKRSRQSLGARTSKAKVTLPPNKKHKRQVVRAASRLQGPEALWRMLYTAITFKVLTKRKATLNGFASLVASEYEIPIETATSYCVFHAADLISLMQLGGTTPAAWTRLPLYKNLGVAKLTDEQRQAASKVHLTLGAGSVLAGHLADFEWTQSNAADAPSPTIATASDLIELDSDMDRSRTNTPLDRPTDGHKYRSGLRPFAGKGFGKGFGKHFTGGAGDGEDLSEMSCILIDDDDDGDDDNGSVTLTEGDGENTLIDWAGLRPSQSSLNAAAIARATSSPQPEVPSTPSEISSSRRASRRQARHSRIQDSTGLSSRVSTSLGHGPVPKLEVNEHMSPSEIAEKGANAPGDVWNCEAVGCRYVVYNASDPASREEIFGHATEHYPVRSSPITPVSSSRRPLSGKGPGYGRTRGKGKGRGSSLAAVVRDDDDDDDDGVTIAPDLSDGDAVEDDIPGPMSGLVSMVRREARGRLPVSYLITRIRDMAGGSAATAAAAIAEAAAAPENATSAEEPVVNYPSRWEAEENAPNPSTDADGERTVDADMEMADGDAGQAGSASPLFVPADVPAPAPAPVPIESSSEIPPIVRAESPLFVRDDTPAFEPPHRIETETGEGTAVDVPLDTTGDVSIPDVSIPDISMQDIQDEDSILAPLGPAGDVEMAEAPEVVTTEEAGTAVEAETVAISGPSTSQSETRVEVEQPDVPIPSVEVPLDEVSATVAAPATMVVDGEAGDDDDDVVPSSAPMPPVSRSNDEAIMASLEGELSADELAAIAAPASGDVVPVLAVEDVSTSTAIATTAATATMATTEEVVVVVTTAPPPAEIVIETATETVAVEASTQEKTEERTEEAVTTAAPAPTTTATATTIPVDESITTTAPATADEIDLPLAAALEELERKMAESSGGSSGCSGGVVVSDDELAAAEAELAAAIAESMSMSPVVDGETGGGGDDAGVVVDLDAEAAGEGLAAVSASSPKLDSILRPESASVVNGPDVPEVVVVVDEPEVVEVDKSAVVTLSEPVTNGRDAEKSEAPAAAAVAVAAAQQQSPERSPGRSPERLPERSPSRSPARPGPTPESTKSATFLSWSALSWKN